MARVQIMLWRMLIIAILLATGAVAILLHQQWPRPVIVSGVIEADEIRVGSRIGGRVAEVPVEEGQKVSANSVLLRLDPFNLKEQLAEAQAQARSAVAVLDKAQAGFRPEEKARAQAHRDHARAVYDEAVAGPREYDIAEASEQHQLAIAEWEKTKQNLLRVEHLIKVGAESAEAHDLHRAALLVAQATVNARKARLDNLKSGTRSEQITQTKARLDEAEADLRLIELGTREEEIAEAKAKADAAEARVELIRRQIDELTILAPRAATIQACRLRPGDMIAVNAPIITLTDRSRMWVRAYVPAAYLGLVSLGTELEVAVDGFPGRTFRGRVMFVAQDAEFTPSNVQTPDKRGQQVYRVRVELLDVRPEIRPGMSAEFALPECTS